MSLISVIVPVYNVEKYLNKCIDSIVNQSYDNLEIILVDDGSTDNSGTICDIYAKNDSRIKVIHQECSGVAVSRNVGLDNSTGEYISFVDSDDYIDSKMIEKLYQALIKENADVSMCNFSNVNENAERILELDIKSPIKTEVISRLDMYKKLACGNCWYYVILWNKLYKKEVFEDIRFPEGKIHEDEILAHYIVEKCNKISSVDDVLYYYVKRQGSIMSTGITIKRIMAVEAFFDRAVFYIKKKHYELAEQVLVVGINTLAEISQKTEKNIENRKKIKEQKKKFNKVYFRIIKEKISIRRKMLLMIYFMNINIPIYISNFRTKRKQCREGLG